jgi:hypothetical protein
VPRLNKSKRISADDLSQQIEFLLQKLESLSQEVETAKRDDLMSIAAGVRAGGGAIRL